MSKPTTVASLVIIVGLAVLAIASPAPAEAAETNETESAKLKAAFKLIEPCMLNAVISFIYRQSYPPKSTEALGQMCERQTEALKCLKDKSKSMPALPRRGVVSFVSTRQRANKKLCTNLQSDSSKRFVQDFKCIMEKRFAEYKANDVEFASMVNVINQKHFKDGALELKYFCCTVFKYRRNFIEGGGSECSGAKQSLTDVIMSMVGPELNFVCEDEEKMTKDCAELKPLEFPREFDPAKNASPSSASLHLIATLGE